MTPEQDALLRDLHKKATDTHNYVFSSERGKRRPPRAEEIDAMLDGGRFIKWTARSILYISAIVAAIAGMAASAKGWWYK